MTTPLQKAAQALIERWDSPAWKDQPHTAEYIEELRKALDAEIAESVEPDFYTACAEHNGGWIPLPGYSNETEHGVKSRILEDARKEGWKGTIEGRLFALGWQVMPVYLHPPQPQAATPVPDLLKEFKNVMSWIDNWSPEFSCDPDWPDDRDKAHAAIAAAQGEKP